MKLLINTVCKVDAGELRTISKSGPAILITNHTTNIEGPALYVLVQPRKTTGLGKVELWQKRFTRFLMNTWGIIPVHRGRLDAGALRACLKALKGGSLLGVAPEGTRSKSGLMKKAERGVAMLAARTEAPVYPAAQWGFRDIGSNIKKLRRTPVTFRVGRPFIVRVPKSDTSSPTVMRRVADEMMYQIARMLPAKYRGVYSDLSLMTTEYLQFIQPRTAGDETAAS